MTLRDKYPLESSKPLKKALESSLVLLMFLAFFFAGYLFIVFSPGEVEGDPSFISLLFSLSPFKVFLGILSVLFFFFLCKYVYEVYYLKHYFYDVSKELLIIRKGVFSRNEIFLPMKRIQDVYVDQDILDRMFGLYDVHVSSATEISANLGHIDGLNKEGADAIKKIILSGVHKRR